MQIVFIKGVQRVVLGPVVLVLTVPPVLVVPDANTNIPGQDRCKSG